MKPLLIVFIDGLKPESVEYMDFLKTFNVRRIKTELINYSPTCHASMYTGVYPNKHLQLFIWKFSPNTSPFKILKKLKLHKIPHNIYTKFFIYAALLRIKYNIPYTLMFSGLSKQPISNWLNFDFDVVKSWTEPDPFVGKYPIVFKILKDNNINYEIVGMQPKGAKSSESVQAHKPKKIKPVTYYYIGDMDPLSDKYGQDSKEAKVRLNEIDKILEEKYKLFEKEFKDFYFMLFSDHGHIKVEERIDLYSFFKVNGKDLNSYIHFVDALHLRFWFRNEKEKDEVTKILAKLESEGVGYILTDEIMKKYHSEMPDNRYGDLIFYIDVPYISKTCPVNSMHGYSPEYPDSDGVFVTNREITTTHTHIKLQDIAPSILHTLNIEIPEYMDGSVVWK